MGPSARVLRRAGIIDPVPVVPHLPDVRGAGRALDEIPGLLDAAFDEFSEDDWLHSLGGWHAAVTEAGELVSHAAAVPRIIEVDGEPFRTGYVEAVATTPPAQLRGLGSLAMESSVP